MPHHYKLLIFLLLVLCFCDRPDMVRAEKEAQAPASIKDKQQTSLKREQLERIVLSKLAFYAKQYPQIDFVILDTSGDVARNMQVLNKIIGQDPEPLDYAYPQELRQDLLMVTLMRIELLLNADIGSATLFKPGEGALARRKQVCVVTMNPWLIAADDRAATRDLLEIPDTEFAAIPETHYLKHADHLKFSLDHEIYHCLDTIYNGPIPMSHRKLWGDYQMLKDETGADAFGVIMHLAAHHSITPYAKMIWRIRGLTLLGNDPNHFTYLAIGAALQEDPAQLASANVQQRFRIATQISRRVIGSYEDYVRYAHAAERAMRQLGVNVSEEQIGSQGEVDQALVAKLVKYTQDAYRELVGRDMPRN